jgi:hypothetical protein
MNSELTQDQALSVLIQGVRLAQKAGAYTIEDAELIAKAIKVFVKPTDAAAAPEVTAEVTPEVENKA